MTVARTRSALYSIDRFLGDVQAVRRGRVGRRFYNKAVGRTLVRPLRGPCPRNRSRHWRTADDFGASRTAEPSPPDNVTESGSHEGRRLGAKRLPSQGSVRLGARAFLGRCPICCEGTGICPATGRSPVQPSPACDLGLARVANAAIRLRSRGTGASHFEGAPVGVAGPLGPELDDRCRLLPADAFTELTALPMLMSVIVMRNSEAPCVTNFPPSQVSSNTPAVSADVPTFGYSESCSSVAARLVFVH
jgi:hypothetical protein